jgi:hypothetical protein
LPRETLGLLAVADAPVVLVFERDVIFREL